MLEFLGTQTIHIFVDSFTTDEGNEASLLVFRDENGHWFVFNTDFHGINYPKI